MRGFRRLALRNQTKVNKPNTNFDGCNCILLVNKECEEILSKPGNKANPLIIGSNGGGSYLNKICLLNTYELEKIKGSYIKTFRRHYTKLCNEYLIQCLIISFPFLQDYPTPIFKIHSAIFPFIIIVTRTDVFSVKSYRDRQKNLASDSHSPFGHKLGQWQFKARS